MASVDTLHAEYETAAVKWRRMRDVISGQDAIHVRGTAYLPRLSEQTDADYAAYKLRASWFGATSRTVDALHGLMFRKAPVIEAPEGMAGILDDLTLAGQSVEGFIASLGRESLEVGRGGVLVDYPSVREQPGSLGAAEASGLRPFATLYKAESIINWRSERIDNRMMLTLVVLAETHEEWEPGAFEPKTVPQFRVLRLNGGRYVQEVYRGGDKGLDLAEKVAPTMRGQPMRFIPFVIVGPEQIGPEISDPPLIDMADLNLSHYRTTADLEHGAHYTGLPMLMLTGVTMAESEKVAIGSQTAVVSDNPAAKGFYIEFEGHGLGSLERLIERKEAQMAALGASMLAAPKKGVEAADTHEMRTVQETSALADIAGTVSQAMTQVLEWVRDWAGLSGDVSVEVSTDYVVTQMTAQQLTALLGAWQAGAISRATLFWNLQQGELVAPGKTVDDEQSEIDAEGPRPGMETGAAEEQD